MIRLGCIADDFTGGTDVAAALRRAGLSVTLQFGQPGEDTATPTTDAVVIALKTRTIPRESAVLQTLGALRWLQSQDAERYYFKYCSTFDSTDEGNIGPVADALVDALGEPASLICPASPEHGRTSYLGHLFVGDVLLSESSMRHHPLTPMTDPVIPRVLQRQTPGSVGLLALPTVRAGVDAVRARVSELLAADTRHLVVDAIVDEDLGTVAAGAAQLRLFTGGAGLAGALGAWIAARSDFSSSKPSSSAITAAAQHGGQSGVILAGSCSSATLGQVAAAAEVFPSYRLDPAETPDPYQLLDRALGWVEANWHRGPLMVYSSAGPEERRAAVAAMGEKTAEVLEGTLGQVARKAAELGARRIVVAGGETSGAVVQALEVDQVTIAGEEDRGVPWCLTNDDRHLALLLKSGNFGTPDLLVRAMEGPTR